MKYSKTQDSVYCAPCRFFVNCIRFQIKLNPLHIWQNKISKSTTYLYYITLLNILFLKIYVQKLTCCSWKSVFRGIIFSARKLQECRILHHLPQNFWGPQTPCRKSTSARWGRVTFVTSTRLLSRIEYTSFWGSYAPGFHIIFWTVCMHPSTREKCSKFLIKSSHISVQYIVKHVIWYGQKHMS
jgi:hypothetical protein